MEVNKLWSHVQETYAVKRDNEAFLDDVQDRLGSAENIIRTRIDTFDNQVTGFERHVKVEVKKAKAALLPSKFDDLEGQKASLTDIRGVPSGVHHLLDGKADKGAIQKMDE